MTRTTADDPVQPNVARAAPEFYWTFVQPTVYCPFTAAAAFSPAILPNTAPETSPVPAG